RPRAFPLSSSQERLWLLDRLLPGSPVYNIHQSLWLEGALDVGALEAGLRRVVERHEVLRTTFRTESGGPVQVVAPEVETGVGLVDLTAIEPERRSGLARELARREARFPFDLERGPLLRLTVMR
ncbi:MAG: non-ribosomal peptide synthetase, partial [Gammaproteobacteria bacterium]|nr:non-ribosomal peptide synthetase [Gemmatimonadota bacterium]NIU80046.1 non-ribosomal peptide synthetase [Gammaproteobacteria bacterium]NIX25517.1 non-ribosomal peptide synthetase [Actinomycetota bacterium]